MIRFRAEESERPLAEVRHRDLPRTCLGGSHVLDKNSNRVTLIGPVSLMDVSTIIVFPEGEVPVRYELRDELVSVGRSASNQIQILCPHVSERHLNLLRSLAGWEMVDLGSRNGTWVNGESVTRCILQGGDRILIGKAVPAYFVHSATEEAADVFLPSEEPVAQETHRYLKRVWLESTLQAQVSLRGLDKKDERLRGGREDFGIEEIQDDHLSS